MATTQDDSGTRAKLRARAIVLEAWLAENAPEVMDERIHLDEGSSERAYWHLGYLSALRDVLALMQEGS